MAELPVCLIAGIGGRKPEVIIKGIYGNEAVPQPENVQDDIVVYKLDISTKYYSASINLCCVQSDDRLPQLENQEVHAIVLYINELTNTLSEIDSILESCSYSDVEVKLLVCDQCAAEDHNVSRLSKLKVQQWCIQNGFELVEIDPLEIPDPDDDFPETLGIPRIIQALHAYTWPNLVMKGDEQKKIQHIVPAAGIGAENESSEIEYERLGADGVDEATSLQDMEGFEQLFGQLNVMRNKATSLQGEERRAYAERMAVAFWRALGGDEEEIEGLTSDDI